MSLKKLTLNLETLRSLDTEESARVDAGMMNTWDTCPSGPCLSLPYRGCTNTLKYCL